MRSSAAVATWGLAALGLANACSTLAGLDDPIRPVPVDPGGRDSGDPDAAMRVDRPGDPSDARVPNVADATDGAADDAEGKVKLGACACASATHACCIAAGGAASCVVRDAGGCGPAGSLWLVCHRNGSNGRDCCWNDAGTGTELGPACAAGRTSCIEDVDCPSGTCNTIDCKGVVIGACGPGQPPACPR